MSQFENCSISNSRIAFENLNTNGNISNITLDNKILQANAEFRFRYVGTGTGNIINLLDKNSANIYIITDSDKNS